MNTVRLAMSVLLFQWVIFFLLFSLIFAYSNKTILSIAKASLLLTPIVGLPCMAIVFFSVESKFERDLAIDLVPTVAFVATIAILPLLIPRALFGNK